MIINYGEICSLCSTTGVSRKRCKRRSLIFPFLTSHIVKTDILWNRTYISGSTIQKREMLSLISCCHLWTLLQVLLLLLSISICKALTGVLLPILPLTSTYAKSAALAMEVASCQPSTTAWTWIQKEKINVLLSWLSSFILIPWNRLLISSGAQIAMFE